MNSFAYYSPQTIQHAYSLLEEYGSEARLLSGGTDLVVRIKTGRFSPQVVIDLKSVPELNGGVIESGREIHVGALTTMAALHTNSLVMLHFPALAEAAASVGSVQIRNRATIAGNICNASPAADSAPPLLIYNASIKVVSQTSDRVVPIEKFILGPGKTALRQGELVEAILIPIPGNDQAAAFDRLTRRKGVDLATINLCCQVFKTGHTRFAIGAAGPVPFLVEDSSGDLVNPSVKEEYKRQLILTLMKKASPISDVRASKEYRQAMLTVLGRRALYTALERLQAAQ